MAIKIITFLLTFLFGLCSYGQNEQAMVRGKNVNVRACASTTCQVLFRLNTGDSCKIIEVSQKEEEVLGYGINPWFKIMAGQQEGYIYGAFVSIDKATTKVGAHNANWQFYSTVTGDNVNVRACGNMACKKVFQLHNQEKVKVISRTGNDLVPGIGYKPWYEIEYKGRKGFIFGHYLDCDNCDFSTAPNNNITCQTGTIVGDKVNVRSGQGTGSKVLFQMNIGDKCVVKRKIKDSSQVGQQYPWYEIEANGRTGFVFGKFVSVNSNIRKLHKVWALVVGVSDYSRQMNYRGVEDLSYSDEDAKRIYQFLKSPEGGNLPNNQIALLRNSEGTKANILANADRLFKKANKDDMIIIYFSGHGGPNYLVAHDQVVKYSSIKSIMEKSAAKKRLCVADACYSGTWSNHSAALATKSVLDEQQLEQLYYEALANSDNGIALLMSSGRNETSIEIPQLGQGLFTHYYIEGLKGAADSDRDRVVTLQELYEFVRSHVSHVARALFQHKQTPKLSGQFDTDMPLGVVR